MTRVGRSAYLTVGKCDCGEGWQICLTLVRVGRCVCLAGVSVGRCVCLSMVRVGRSIYFTMVRVGKCDSGEGWI